MMRLYWRPLLSLQEWKRERKREREREIESVSKKRNEWHRENMMGRKWRVRDRERAKGKGRELMEIRTRNGNELWKNWEGFWMGEKQGLRWSWHKGHRKQNEQNQESNVRLEKSKGTSAIVGRTGLATQPVILRNVTEENTSWLYFKSMLLRRDGDNIEKGMRKWGRVDEKSDTLERSTNTSNIDCRT